MYTRISFRTAFLGNSPNYYFLDIRTCFDSFTLISLDFILCNPKRKAEQLDYESFSAPEMQTGKMREKDGSEGDTLVHFLCVGHAHLSWMTHLAPQRKEIGKDVCTQRWTSSLGTSFHLVRENCLNALLRMQCCSSRRNWQALREEC